MISFILPRLCRVSSIIATAARYNNFISFLSTFVRSRLTRSSNGSSLSIVVRIRRYSAKFSELSVIKHGRFRCSV